MAARSAARLRMTLDDVEPTVLRIFDVPFDIRLDRLHDAIQAVMGWTNSHLWEIRIGEVGFGPPGMNEGWGDGPRNASKITLEDALADIGGKTLTYLYDFGDGWEHAIRVQKIFEADAETSLPALLEAKGSCPPEDIGGPWGYAEFREALADPGHERHDELTEWHGDSWNPDEPCPEAIHARFKALAKRWSRKPAPRKKPRA